MALFGKPTPEAFAKSLLKTIKAIAPERKYAFDEDEFRLVRQDAQGTISLTNIFAEYEQRPRGDRKQFLKQIAAVFAADQNDQLPDTFDEARPNLRPKVYNRSTFEFLQLKSQLTGEETLDLPLYPLGDHLYGSIVFDTEHAMQSVSKEQLENWGANYYEAFEVACENLAETSIAYASLGDHFHSALSGDNYDSSRIFLIDRIQQMDVRGDIIGMVPQRDAMYITGSDDVDGLKAMLHFTRATLEEQPRPLSPLPLRLVDGQWVQWTVPDDHELKSEFEDLERSFLAGLYHHQQQLLNALLEAGESIPFVASYSAVQKKDTGEVSTYCVWGEGVDSLLPKTDSISFVSEMNALGQQDWDTVARVVGPLLSPDESHYPIRYRCREFPSEQQLKELGFDDRT